MSEQAGSMDSFLSDDGTLSAAGWADAVRAGRLIGQACDDCDHVTAAPKAACASCGSRSLQVVELPTTGEVHSETTIEVAPAGFEAPYTIVIVSVGNARVLGRTDEDVSIGDTVELCDALEAENFVSPVFE